MERRREGLESLPISRLDIVLISTFVGLGALTLAFALDRSFTFALQDRSLDVTVNALIVLAALSLSALTLARYRESGRVAGLFQSSGFLLMGWVTFVNVAIVALKLDPEFDLSLAAAEWWQLPFYVSASSRIVAGSLLLVGGLAALNHLRQVPRTRRTLLLPVIAVSLLAVALFPLRQLLPPFLGPEAVQALIEGPRVTGVLSGVTSLAFAAQLLAATLFVGGALLYRRSYLRRGPVADGYLAVALLLAAFAEIHFLLYPGLHAGLVTTADGIRLAFFFVLLLGISAEARSDLRALRTAYAALERLRRSEAERAALEERTRLARELHDGLAQDLWFAKLKHERLLAHLPDDQRALAQEVTQALDAAIVEARQALVTMRAGLDRDRPLHEILGEAVEEFGGRTGVRADFSAADLPAALPPRTQAEVLRVLQEALTNVSKHADATVVRVNAEVSNGTLLLSVVDNGRGFRPDETFGDGLGVQGMKERARLMGGELRVISEPSSGTGVHLSVPVSDGLSA